MKDGVQDSLEHLLLLLLVIITTMLMVLGGEQVVAVYEDVVQSIMMVNLDFMEVLLLVRRSQSLVVGSEESESEQMETRAMTKEVSDPKRKVYCVPL